ncbi:protein sprouty homolog 2 [Galendromus occidentalis]|uniref:Protein sprouty homolog 2 n=1 Tax=Galendromus occidentalis TaxID=34638 RepID=A0AAJ7WHX3_9ACAR|nr:protein sprouty homolog 2 [Galendromus occidentalis]
MSHNSFSSPASSGPGRPGMAITLSQPRPGAARRQNEYLDSPLRAPPPLPATSPLGSPASFGLPSAILEAPKKGSSSGALLKAPPRTPIDDLCKKQNAVNLNESTTTASSIVCRDCGKCRCEACQEPKALPSRWICNDKFHCSAHNIVEHVTCLCCAQAVFYHYAKDTDLDSDVSCADKPCSCGPEHFWSRWGCLAMMSAILPCLCCYPPLKGCVNVCESAYGRWTSRCGCHCEYKNPNKLLSST